MISLAPGTSRAQPRVVSARDAPLESPVPWIEITLLACAGLFALRPLALVWRSDPDYAFGWGVPFLAAYLFYARWSGRPQAQPSAASPSALFSILLPWTLLFFVVRQLQEVVPDWRPGLWTSTSLYLAGLTAWCWLRGGRAWVSHFLFSICFLLSGVPWLYNLEAPVVQALMRGNASLVAASLLLVDLPARAEGNTLLLTTGQLGIEEACSGIRSLQAATMMALFLGEFYRVAWRQRGVLVLLGVVFALLGNYLRLFWLALRGARGGIHSVASMHAAAGAEIFIGTIGALWLACLTLRGCGKTGSSRETTSCARPPVSKSSSALWWAAGLLVAVVISEAGTQAWFGWKESGALPVSSWTLRWPTDLRDFHVIPIPPATHELLQDQHGAAGSWRDDRKWTWQAYWFQYPARTANRLAIDVHNPSACLAAAGWRETADCGQFDFVTQSFAAPVHGYQFSSGANTQYVFWLVTLDRVTARPGARECIYQTNPSAFLERVGLWARAAGKGIRSAQTETLEVSITGPPDYPSARRAFLAFVHVAVAVPARPPAPPQ